MTFDFRAAQQFLAEPHVAVFAVAAPEGPPAAVPLWYRYEPDGPLWIIVGTTTRKARLTRDTGRATLVVDAVTPRIRFVSVELTLVEVRHPTIEEFQEMSSPHLAGDQLSSFLEFAATNLEREHTMIFDVVTWRYGDITP